MPDPRVITFEKDIEEEIRSKAASLTDIASASGYVASAPTPVKKPSAFLLPSIILICILFGVGGAFFYLHTQREKASTTTPSNEGSRPLKDKVGVSTPEKTSVTSSTTGINSATKIPETKSSSIVSVDREAGNTKRIVKTPFSDIFPLTAPFIGQNITKVETLMDSYVITFNSYSEVYKRVNDHESELAEDLQHLYNTSSSTTLLASSTKAVFRDVRINSVDSRELTYGEGKKVYYAFIKPNSLIISETKKAIEDIAHNLITP